MLAIRNRRMALAIAVSTPPLFTSPTKAQIVVYDPTNYVQNALQAARSLLQVTNQITSLQNEAQMLINQARNLANLPYSSLQRRAHYRRLSLPTNPKAFLEPLIERAHAGARVVVVVMHDRCPFNAAYSASVRTVGRPRINSRTHRFRNVIDKGS
jgi:hypothetical protein